MTYLLIALLRACQGVEKSYKKGRDKRTTICPHCRTEYPRNAACCVHCGSKAGITVAELKQYDEYEKAAANRLFSAKEHYDGLIRTKYCSHCNLSHGEEIAFCPECASQCVAPPAEFIFQWMSETYPDLVSTEEDLKNVAHTQLPLGRKVGRMAVNSAVGAAKKAGRWAFR